LVEYVRLARKVKPLGRPFFVFLKREEVAVATEGVANTGQIREIIAADRRFRDAEDWPEG
jgi:hypothetical protein